MVCGPHAARSAHTIQELQTVLGNRPNTVSTELWLRQAAQSNASVGLVAGLLIAGQRGERATVRRHYESVWVQATRPSLRA